MKDRTCRVRCPFDCWNFKTKFNDIVTRTKWGPYKGHGTLRRRHLSKHGRLYIALFVTARRGGLIELYRSQCPLRHREWRLRSLHECSPERMPKPIYSRDVSNNVCVEDDEVARFKNRKALC